MRNLYFTTLFFLSICSYAQKQATGLLTANAQTNNIISQYDGTYFWLIHNSKYTFADNQGNIMLENVGMKNTFTPTDNSSKILNGIFTDYNNKNHRFRFVSVKDKKPLTDFVYETIIPYNNNTYFVVKNVNKKKEYIYYDENLKVIYKVTPNSVAKKLNVSLTDYSRSMYMMSMSDEKYKILFGKYNDGLIKQYNPVTKKFGFINTKGALVIPHKYKKVGNFSEGLAYFKDESKLYGYINKKGVVIIPPKFGKQVYSFSSGRAKVVSKKGFFGFIDTENNVAIQPMYRYATNFYKNRALVKKDFNSPIQLIDISGKVIKEFDKNLKISFQEKASQYGTMGIKVDYLSHINPVLKQLVDFNKGVFNKGKYGTTGLIDIDGNVILDFKYIDLKDYNNGLLLAIFLDKSKSKRQALINEKGKLVVEATQSQF